MDLGLCVITHLSLVICHLSFGRGDSRIARTSDKEQMILF